MDRLTEMEAFVAVVEQGGFTDAARKMDVSKSAVSKHVSSLEARLGARLLRRTTRRVSPTEVGLAYYDRARNVLNDASEAYLLVSALESPPSGHLKISVATDFGRQQLAPVIDAFLHRFPDIDVSMTFENRYVELMGDNIDVAIRTGGVMDSSLRSRRLADATMSMVASPCYFEKFGQPEKIDDLNTHRLLHSSSISAAVWNVRATTGEMRHIRATGRLSVNDGQSLLSAAVSGLGIAYLPSFLYGDALRKGAVQKAMPDGVFDDLGIYAVCAPSRFTEPKVRAFMDFMTEAFIGKGPDHW